MGFLNFLESWMIEDLARERGVSVEEAARIWEDERPERERRARENAEFLRGQQEVEHRQNQEEQARLDLEFGRQIGLGVRAYPADAARLSQLSANSSGSGGDRRAVIHVVVDEPFESGRLRRSPGQYLCSTSLRPFETFRQIPGTPITCPRCLNLLERHRRT